MEDRKMKNKRKIVLLALLSLAFAGCKNTDSTSSATVSGSEIQEVPSESHENGNTAKPSEAPDTGSGNNSTSGSESASTSTSTSTVKTLWNATAKKLREKYFDGTIIPYVSIGSYDVEWVDDTYKEDTYLHFVGSDFDKTKLASFKQTYESEGWTTEKESAESITFKKGAFQVEIGEDNDLFDRKAYYACVFDASKAPSAYDTDTLDELQTVFGSLTTQIPYIYLGAPVTYAKTYTTSPSARIYGYTFDASILTTAEATFKAAGWTVTETSKSNGPTITAVKEFSSTGDVLTITLDTPSSTVKTRYARYIVLTEKWDNTLASAWPSTLASDFAANCDNHTPTFFYLGTKNPTYDYDSDSYKFKITGGVFDERTIPGVKTTLQNAGWTVEDTEGSYGTGLRATYSYPDGCRFKVLINRPSSSTSKVIANVYYIPKLTIPAEATAWPDQVKNTFTAQFGSDIEIPFVYLGGTDATADYSNAYASRSIETETDGTFSTSRIVIKAIETFKAAGWTVTVKDGDEGDDRFAEKTFTNGDKITATLESVDVTDKCSLELQKYEKYDSTYSTKGSWASDRGADNLTGGDTTSTGHSRDQNFGGHSLPYIYLGTKHHNSSWNDKKKRRTVYGGTWDSQLLTQAKASFTNDNAKKATGDGDWTFTQDNQDLTKATTRTAEKTFADGVTLKAVITKPDDPTTYTPVHVTERTVYVKGVWKAQATDWSQKVKDERTNAGFPATDLVPYVYLGTDDPDVSSTNNNYQKYIQIQGAIFEDRVLTEFDNSRTKAGWTLVTEHKTRFGKESHEAYKVIKDANGNETGILRAGISRWTDNDDAVVSRRVFYDDKAKADTSTPTVWTDAQKKTRKETLDQTDESVLPSLPIGTGVKVSSSTANGGYVTIKGNRTSNYFNRKNIKETLEKDGWTAAQDVFTSDKDPTYVSTVTAQKKISNGTLELTATPGSSSVTITVLFRENFAAPTGDKAAWSDKVTASFNKNRNGYQLPYFYRGAQNPDVTESEYSNPHITLTGLTWNDAIWTNRKTALGTDTTITNWQFGIDYTYLSKSGSYSSYYQALVYEANGSYTVTTPAVKDKDGTVITPEKTETHYVSLKLHKGLASEKERPILQIFYF